MKASEANSYASVKSLGIVAAATASITSSARDVFSVAFKEGDWVGQERTLFGLSLCIIILSAFVAGTEVVLVAVKPGRKGSDGDGKGKGNANANGNGNADADANADANGGNGNEDNDLYHFGRKTKICNATASLVTFLILAFEALVSGLEQATQESGSAGNGTATAAP